MRLILSSCDFGNAESAKFIKNHLCKPIADCKVLYFPNEKATPETIKSGKYETRLASFGFQKKNIYVANYWNPSAFFDLKIDLIYISGGNTFGTMKRLRESGLDQAILNYVQNGVIYIGGSAGAHIATANIAHVAKYDKDTFGLTDFSGLGLFGGILICHYNEERQADLEELKSIGTYSVYALTDTKSILIRDE
ncbi:MAG: Type 1 glutamine amidotransferase-like domain-containing protein [Clostridia bacterium]|nr:Type 1 glutamine amidotransferase-like domain-containing protein [Clostridia bacterium]